MSVPVSNISESGFQCAWSRHKRTHPGVSDGRSVATANTKINHVGGLVAETYCMIPGEYVLVTPELWGFSHGEEARTHRVSSKHSSHLTSFIG